MCSLPKCCSLKCCSLKCCSLTNCCSLKCSSLKCCLQCLLGKKHTVKKQQTTENEMRVSTIRALEEMFFEQKRLCVPSFPTTSPHHTYHSQHSHSSAPSTDNPRTGSQRHPFACTPRPPAHTPRFVTVAALNRDGRSPGTRGRISGKASASSAETTYQASNYTAIHLRFLCRGEVGKCDTLFDLRPRIRLGPV